MGQDSLEEVKKIALILGAIVIIAILGFFLLKSTNVGSSIESKVIDHNVFTYKEDSTIAIYNTKQKKYLDSIRLTTTNTSFDEMGYKNFFDIEDYGDKKVIASPQNNELVIVSFKNNTIVKEGAITANGLVENFKVRGSKLFVQYEESNVVEIFSLDTKKLEDKLEFGEKVTNIEIDDENLYVGVGDFIEILSNKTLDVTKSIKIHIGGQAVSIKKSENNFLYVATDFGTDLSTSVLVKVDIEKKNVDNVLSLNKEYPIAMLEKGDYIYVLCKGITDTVLDGISIVDKDSLEKYKSISTGNTPNSMFFTEDGYIYVSHDDGSIVAINPKKDFSMENNFTINGIKEISFAPTTKETE